MPRPAAIVRRAEACACAPIFASTSSSLSSSRGLSATYFGQTSAWPSCVRKSPSRRCVLTRQIDVLRPNLEEAVRMIVSAETLGEIRPDAIAVQHAADFLLERHHHGERSARGITCRSSSAHDRETIEARRRRR